MQIYIDGANRTRVILHNRTELFISYTTCVAARLPSGERVRSEIGHSRTTVKMLGEWGMADAPKKPQAFLDAIYAKA